MSISSSSISSSSSSISSSSSQSSSSISSSSKSSSSSSKSSSSRSSSSRSSSSSSAFVLARYFINGGVDNKWSTVGNWSYTSGGTGGAPIPTASNDVFFDANSPSCTMDTVGSVLSVTWTGYVGTISGSNALTIYGNSTGTGGTVSCPIIFNATGSCDARTWGGLVTYCNTTGAGTFTRTPSAGTHNFNGGISNAGTIAGGTVVIAANTNNPTINVADLTLATTAGTLTLSMGSGTWTCSGNADFAGVDTQNYNTSTFVMTGTGKTLNTCSFYNFTCSGSVTASGQQNFYGDVTVSGTLSVGSIAAMWTASKTLTLTGGTLSGAGQFYFNGQNQVIPTDGTFSTQVRFGSVITITIPARTWGGGAIFGHNNAGNTYTLGAGTHTFNGNVGATSSAPCTIDMATNSPTVNFNGNFDTSGAASVNYTIQSGSGTHTVTGNIDFSKVTTSTYGTSTYVMSGTSKSLIGNNNFYNMTFSGSITGASPLFYGNVIISGTYTTSGASVMAGTGKTLTLTGGTLNGSGQFYFNGPSATIPSDGTISCECRCAAANSIPARTWGGNVKFGSPSGSMTITFGAGTHTFSNGLTVYDNSATTLDMSANPTVNVTGNFDTSTAINNNGVITAGASAITITGNLNLTKTSTFTPGTSTWTMSGTSKTITMNTSQTFANLTISGTIQALTTDFTVSSVLSVTGTFDIDERTITHTGSLSMGVAGTISDTAGTGFYNYKSSTTFNQTNGTISAITWFGGATVTVNARTWAGLVTYGGLTGGPYTITLAAGTHTFNGGLSNSKLTGATTYTFEFGSATVNATATNALNWGTVTGANVCTVNWGSATINVTGNMNVSGIDATLNTSAVITVLPSAGTQCVGPTGGSFPDLVIANTSATMVPSGVWTVGGNFTINASVSWRPFSANPTITINGNISISATCTYVAGSNPMTLGGSSGSQTIALGGKTIGGITMNASGATKVLGPLGFTTGNLILTAGTWDTATNNPNMTVTGNISVAAAVTYSPGTGTMTLGNTTGTQTIDFGGKTVCALKLDCTGTIKQFSANGFTCPSMLFAQSVTGTMTIDFATNASTVVVTGAITYTGRASSTVALSMNGCTMTFGSIAFSDTVGTLNVTPGSATLNTAGAINLNGVDSWTTGTCTWNLTGTTGTQAIAFGGITIYNLTMNASGATKQLGPLGVTISGTFTLTAGTWNTATNNPNFQCNGNISIAAAVIYSAGSGTMTLGNTTGTQTIDFGNKTVCALKIDCSGATKQFSANGFTCPSITFASSTNGTSTSDFATNPSTVVVTGALTYTGRASSTQAINTNGCTFTIGSIAFSDTVGTLTVTPGSATFNISGAINLNGVDTWTTGTCLFNLTGSSGTQIVAFGGITVFNITMNASGATKQLGPLGVTIAGTWTLTAGTWDNSANNPNFQCNGNISFGASATYNRGTGTFTLGGSSGTQIIDLGNKFVGALILNCSGAIKQLTGGFTCLSLTLTVGVLQGNGQAVTVTGVATFTAGTVTAGTATAFNFNGNVSIAAPVTWTAGTEVITLGGSASTQTIDLGSKTIYAITLNCSGATKQLTGAFTCITFTQTVGVLQGNGQTLTVSGVATFTAGTVTAGTSTQFNLNGNVSVAAGLTWTVGTEIITLGGSSGIQTVDLAGKTYYTLVVNGSGTTKQLSTAGFTTIVFTVIAGTVSNNTNNPNYTVSGALTISGSAIYNRGTGIITLTGAGSGTQNISVNAQAIESLTVNDSGATKDFLTDVTTINLTGTAGTIKNSTSNPVWTIQGNINIAVAAVWTRGTGTINLTGSSGTQTIEFRNKTIESLTMNSTGATKSISVNGFSTRNLTLTAGTWDAVTSNPNFTVSGNITVAGPVVYSRGTGVITLASAGSGTQTIEFFGNTIESITMNDTGATKSVSTSGFTTRNLTLTAGTWSHVANNPSLNVTGNITMAASTFTKGTGTLSISGLTTQTLTFNSNTIDNITVINPSASTTVFTDSFTTGTLIAIVPGSHLQGANGTVWTVTTLCRICGSSVTKITIDSDSVGNSFDIDSQGVSEFAFDAMKDIHNIKGTDIQVSFGTNNGNTNNFIFVNSYIWDGGGTDNNWSNPDNWQGNFVPPANSVVQFDATSVKNCTINSVPGSMLSVNISSGYTGTITQMTNFDVISNFTHSEGTYIVGTGYMFDVDGIFTLDGTSNLTADSTVFELCGDVVITTSGTVNWGTSDVVIGNTYSVAQNINFGGTVLYSITVANTSDIVTFSTGFTWTYTFDITSNTSVKFQAGQTFAGTTINWIGTSGNTITLQSTTNGSYWYLNVSAIEVVAFVEVKDSNATGGLQIVAASSIDNGHNPHWDFGTLSSSRDTLGSPGDVYRHSVILMSCPRIGENLIKIF